MNELILDKKKYVVIPRGDYELLQRKAALKAKPEKILSLSEARTYSMSLVRTWAKER